ncbi:13725_t:CDS:1, partial [Acaulospora colombiana]
MSNESIPSFNRHLRLALLCTTSVAICSSFLLAILILNIRIGFNSSTSWTAWDFAHIDIVTAKTLDESPSRKVILALEMILPPVLGLHFFVFFGFIEEAMRRIRGHRFSTNSVLPEAWRRNHRPAESSHRHEAGIIEITPPSLTDHQFAVMPAPLAPTYSVTNHTTATATPSYSPPHSRPSS